MHQQSSRRMLLLVRLRRPTCCCDVGIEIAGRRTRPSSFSSRVVGTRRRKRRTVKEKMPATILFQNVLFRHRCSRVPLSFLRVTFFLSRQLLFFGRHDDGDMKSSDKASISIRRVKSTKVGLKETESNKACTRSIRKKYYEFIWFLWSYKVHPFEFAIHSGGCKVRVNIKTIHVFRTDLLVQSSKLLLYTLVQLIWCSYFI